MKRSTGPRRWLALAGLVACGPGVEHLSSTSSKVIYGDDDRKQVFEVDGALGDIARRSIVSLFEADDGMLDESDPSNIRINASPVGRALDLCKTERFWNEPSAAECSGTLIADDLVLTAGHCMDGPIKGVKRAPADVCKTRRFVFGFYNDADDKLHPITSEDVFSCGELVAHRRDDANRFTIDAIIDFSIVRLDRSAAPRFTPVRLRAGSLKVGEPLTVIGFPSGIPMKVAANGAIVTVHDKGDFFVGTTDTFAGNSGSGVFDSDTLEQIGILVAGQTDYVKKGACSVATTCDATGCDGKSERINQIRPVLEAYCKRSDAREELCKSL